MAAGRRLGSDPLPGPGRRPAGRLRQRGAGLSVLSASGPAKRAGWTGLAGPRTAAPPGPDIITTILLPHYYHITTHYYTLLHFTTLLLPDYYNITTLFLPHYYIITT
jgi:hypothetical protein